MGKTLFDKVWDAHVVESIENGPQIIYIDRHLIHEVTSPQAFAELESRNKGIMVFLVIIILVWSFSINSFKNKERWIY